MKKLALILSIIGGMTVSAQAQKIETIPQTTADVGTAPIQKGNWMVGGSIGNIGYSFEGKAFNIQLQPRAGYFVSDGIAVGAQANLGLTAIKGEDNEWNYGIAPFVRYYFPEGGTSSGRFFAQGDIGIAGSSVGKGASLALGANVGYAHFITRTVALEATLGYNYTKANVNLGDKQTGLGVGLGFQIYLPGQR
ncbi:porin family protein [Sphingobacterium sp. SRCM116780]|uniref:porin family protein n=1 Tax=Sphingobacterium sp. SRCM116780 TaxID=2907623 RepID=UPI001F37504A|nr:porin family protein [Sphingobacterium sp. SRCM116780]UIR56940.1 porin family protein [Sphingobacterium sp. SRCM116780]